MTRDTKPNIVYLTTDGHKASALGCYGNPHVPSPFHDRMAAEGITFTQAFATNPICSPSRCSVMTGVHPLVHQLTCHQNRAPWNLPQLPELLQQAGYYTAVAGHYEEIRNLGRGYHEQVDESQRGPLREAYLAWQRAGRADRGWDAGRYDFPAEQSHGHLLTDRAIRMLDAARAGGAPFFLHVSYNDPHPPYFAPAPWDSVVDPAGLPLPPRNDGDDQPAWQKRVAADFGPPASDDDLRKLLAVYYGMIAHANHQMQRLYDALAQRNMLANTWFVIASDHGDYAGDKGLFSHTESLYHCLLHVPLIIRPPDHLPGERGRRADGLVELVDLFSTMLGIAGCAIPEHAQGHDLIAWQRDRPNQPLRDATFAQVGDYHGHLGSTLRGGRPKSARHPGLLQSARTAHGAFIHDPDFGDEAYDYAEDPHELHNLLQRTPTRRQQQIIDDCRARMDRFHDQCLRLRERLGVVPGYRGFDKGWE